DDRLRERVPRVDGVDVAAGPLGDGPACRLDEVLDEMRGRHVRHRADADADADNPSRTLARRHRLDLMDEVREQRALVHQSRPPSSRRIASATRSAAAAAGSDSSLPAANDAPSTPYTIVRSGRRPNTRASSIASAMPSRCVELRDSDAGKGPACAAMRRIVPGAAPDWVASTTIARSYPSHAASSDTGSPSHSRTRTVPSSSPVSARATTR